MANAADRDGIKRQSTRDKLQRDQELADLRAVVATPAGGRVLWRLLGECRVFESIFDPTVRIYALAGRQDVGHWLMTELEQADDQAIFRLMVEARARQKRDDTERQAHEIARAGEKDELT